MRKLLFFLLLSFSLHALSLKDADGDLKPAVKELLSLFDIPSDLPREELVHYLQREWMQANTERWQMDQRLDVRTFKGFPK